DGNMPAFDILVIDRIDEQNLNDCALTLVQCKGYGKGTRLKSLEVARAIDNMRTIFQATVQHGNPLLQLQQKYREVMEKKAKKAAEKAAQKKANNAAKTEAKGAAQEKAKKVEKKDELEAAALQPEEGRPPKEGAKKDAE